MKSKGFTLIELLAVIVILAIIALIATPIVLGIIDESKTNTSKVSAQYIVDAVESAYSIAYTQNQGMTPMMSQVHTAFKMKNATWDLKAKKITSSDVVVTIDYNEEEGTMQAKCKEFGIESQIMQVNPETESNQNGSGDDSQSGTGEGTGTGA